MTKTYNDIEMVTKLLEEKERDLELAARIGQSLLEQNKDLSVRNEELESDLTNTNEAVEKLKFELSNACERITQLKHELSMKNGLLQVYCADIEAQELESEETQQSLEDKSLLLTNWEDLNRRVGSLEEENLRLKNEATSRSKDIEIEEKKELQLIHDCAKQLNEANLKLLKYQDEVGLKGEDNIRQQEEITNLVTQVVELQRKIRDLTNECESLQNSLHVSQECQTELSQELLEIKEKYSTLLSAFYELQSELKKTSRLNVNNCTYMPFNESLASELESTLGSEYSDSEYSSLGFRPMKKKNNQQRDETRCYSPDSLLSGDSLYYRYNNPQPVIGSVQQRSFYFTDKLQIVKPIEGSATLKQWQKLATPHLGTILETLPGVPNKAIKDLNKEVLESTINSIKVMNEKAIIECQTKRHMNYVTTNSIFTYTTTSLSQTTDSTYVTNSFSNVQLSTGIQIPITTSVPSVNFFSQSLPQIKGEHLVAISSQSSPQDSDIDIKVSSCNSYKSYESLISDITCIENLTLKDKSPKKEVNNSIKSDLQLSQNNSNESKAFINNIQSPKRQLKTNENNSGFDIGFDGLGGMSCILDKNCNDGVIMKCNSLLGKVNKQKPNSLALKSQSINETNKKHEIADFSVIKTLRKGGFV
ncbi:trafficking kinesin-binding protein milt-like [Oppia nitens]|uniref:trafficking kinesin-binding protein milt-like n=1 Tax=Oppia nitens TaxID=1686743 RepID=UPI0023DA84B1|nr:trafficking kinesin-binding protein milt-like [Oppia nitens]